MIRIVYSVGRKIIPNRYHGLVRRHLLYMRSRLYYGWRFTCPICGGHFRKFLTFGVKPRQNAQCPGCGSLERHRLFWLYVSRKTNLFDGKQREMLHIAPERALESKFRQLFGKNYLTADLHNPRAMVKMDITDIQYPPESFDIVYCSHVFEHVPDDMKAMAEILRVLKPGGWAILQVPIVRQQTLEDPGITTPEERERVFGQHDHVRAYGLDYKDRLEAAGFVVTVDGYIKELGAELIRKHCLIEDEGIYFCTKPESNTLTASGKDTQRAKHE